jgi:dihydropteroate synthase
MVEPVLRISGRRSLTVTIEGLGTEQARLLQIPEDYPGSGTDLSSVPLSFTLSPARSGVRSAILTGSPGQIRQFLGSFSVQPGALTGLPARIQSLLDNHLRSDYKIDCRGRYVLDLGSRTLVMGILNVTPDSFSDGGRFQDRDPALAHAREMVAAGADILDIGGESTRPGAAPLSEEEELRRIIPVIERLSPEIPVPISVDTYKSRVAERALEAGAAVVNDISGLRFSPDMGDVVAKYGAALVIMHIKGTPRDMQQNPVYGDVVGEILEYLGEGIRLAEQAGIDRERVMIDPGIGFGKTLEHNLEILNRLDEFRSLGRPIVLGTSRKKFIGTVLGIPEPDLRVQGTAATVVLGIERGASVVRVHDVAPMVQAARMADAIVRQKK